MRSLNALQTYPFRLTISDEHRFLVLQGVTYWIPWEDLLPGCSFFLKTLVIDKEVQRALNPLAKHFNVDLVAKQRYERGYYGVRVWRVN